jgi:hypothetical protein
LEEAVSVSKLVCYPAFAFALAASAGRAAQLDDHQLQQIRETASAICNTVKDAKGVKDEVQIEGDVKAQLGGLARRLGADAEVSGKGVINRTEFEGLTQDATTIALGDDRSCRERLFNKMFDAATSAPSPSVQQQLDRIEKLLENKDTQPQKLAQFFDEERFDQKYPLGYALFYSDGSKTLHYGNPHSEVIFDPASIHAISITFGEIIISGFAIKALGDGEMTINATHLHTKVGTTLPLLKIGKHLEFTVDAESLGGSAAGAAWVIGVRPT